MFSYALKPPFTCAGKGPGHLSLAALNVRCTSRQFAFIIKGFCDNVLYMFGIGLPELIIILIVALLVVGPTKLPDLAKSLGQALGDFRRMADDVKGTIEEEMNRDDKPDGAVTEAGKPDGAVTETRKNGEGPDKKGDAEAGKA